MGDLRPSFSKNEFKCKCGCNVYKTMDPLLLDGLQTIRNNTNRTIRVTSGYRCPKHPIEVKKKTPGEHSRCRAADIIISGMDQLDMLAEALKIPQFKNGGIGIYPGKNIIHVDTRPNGPARWSYINGVQKSFSEGYQLLLKQKK